MVRDASPAPEAPAPDAAIPTPLRDTGGPGSDPSMRDSGPGKLLDASSGDAGKRARFDAAPGDSAPAPPLYEQLDCDLPLVVSYCGGGACHYDDAAPELGSSLALWSRDEGRIAPDVEARLVNVPATYQNVQNLEACSTAPVFLVDTVDVEASLLLTKLLGTQACGGEMPKFPYPEWGSVANPGPQREEFVQCIRDWVVLLARDFEVTR
jgi:hypothetical protein